MKTISGLAPGPRLGDELYAVRFPHPTGMVFSEPLPLSLCLQVLDRLKARGLAATLLPAAASDTQPLVLAAEADDRVILCVPLSGYFFAVAKIAFVRVPCDIVLPELGPRQPAPDLSQENISEQLGPGEELLSTRPVGYVFWQLLLMAGRDVLEIASSMLCEVVVRVRTERVRRAPDAQRT